MFDIYFTNTLFENPSTTTITNILLLIEIKKSKCTLTPGPLFYIPRRNIIPTAQLHSKELQVIQSDSLNVNGPEIFSTP